MIRRLILIAAALGLTAAAPAPDWTQRIVATAEGGYAMGNPKAPVTLVEYLSLTCSHCAAFERDGAPALKAQVRTGKVRWEVRNWVRDRADLAAALTVRCAGSPRAFALTRQMLGSQASWMGLGSDAEFARIAALPAEAELAALARLYSFERMALRAGAPAVRLQRCLADPRQAEALLAIKAAGAAMGVSGTPTFLIDGQEIVPTEMDRWPGIERALRARLAR